MATSSAPTVSARWHRRRIGATARPVERFVEKPAREQALELLADPRGAWWNAGIFIWRVDALRDGLAQYAPGVIETLRLGLEGGQSLTSIYEQMPSVSIDRALMEPASLDGRVKVVPADVGWTDLGSWDALQRALAERGGSPTGVVTVGRAEDYSSHNLLAHRPVAAWWSRWVCAIRSSSTHRTSCW